MSAAVTKQISRIGMGLLLASFAITLLADDLCEGNAAQKAKADAQARQAEDLEKSGRAREAYAAAGKVNQDCVTNLNALDALKKRSAKSVAAEEEKKSRYKDAFDWYKLAGMPVDAGRMQRKLVEQKPDDVNTVSHAIDFFHDLPDAAQEKEMRAHAAKNVDKALAEEEKRFAGASKDSLSDLGRANDWAYYAGAGKDKTAARAEKRGDTLIAEEGRRFLELALKYYGFAERKDKEQKVRDKARALGDRAAGKGEGELAAAYYEIAGDQSKAQAMQKQTEAKAQQVEEVRKKSFKKDQDALEKELGLDK
jgi:hypothetical protein